MPILTNALHERFAQGIARGMNGTAAAKDAGYSAHTAHVSASKLMKREDVTARIAELHAAADQQIKREVVVDRAWVTRKLVANIEAAEAAKDLGNVNRGLEILAKMEGFVINRSMDMTPNPLAELSTSQLGGLLNMLHAYEQHTVAQRLMAAGPLK